MCWNHESSTTVKTIHLDRNIPKKRKGIRFRNMHSDQLKVHRCDENISNYQPKYLETVPINKFQNHVRETHTVKFNTTNSIYKMEWIRVKESPNVVFPDCYHLPRIVSRVLTKEPHKEQGLSIKYSDTIYEFTICTYWRRQRQMLVAL
jgi:hypothetical protein